MQHAPNHSDSNAAPAAAHQVTAASLAVAAQRLQEWLEAQAQMIKRWRFVAERTSLRTLSNAALGTASRAMEQLREALEVDESATPATLAARNLYEQWVLARNRYQQWLAIPNTEANASKKANARNALKAAEAKLLTMANGAGKIAAYNNAN